MENEKKVDVIINENNDLKFRDLITDKKKEITNEKVEDSSSDTLQYFTE